MLPDSKPQILPGRSSVFSRLAASTALLAAVIIILAVYFFQSIMGSVFHESFKSPLKEWSETVAQTVSQNLNLAQAVAKNHQVGIVIENGNEVIAFGPDAKPADPKELLKPNEKYRKIEVYMHGGQKFTFLLDRKHFTQEDNSKLLWMLALLVVILGVVYGVQSTQLKPLKWLESGVQAVSRGDFSKRVPIIRKDEIGQVAESFNLMVNRIEQMMEDRERLLADVSHELRSPLARMKVAIELLPENPKLDTIRKDIGEMESLITVLLEREQVKKQLSSRELETVQPAAIAMEVISGFKDSIPSVELELTKQELSFEGDTALIKVLIQNLIDNAVKFSLKDSKPVIVKLDYNDDVFTLNVIDDGQGIPETKQNEIFEAFVKLNPARGHRQGYGLGLNLCQRIVQAHNGTIEIHSNEQRGCIVSVKIPASRVRGS